MGMECFDGISSESSPSGSNKEGEVGQNRVEQHLCKMFSSQITRLVEPLLLRMEEQERELDHHLEGMAAMLEGRFMQRLKFEVQNLSLRMDKRQTQLASELVQVQRLLGTRVRSGSPDYKLASAGTCTSMDNHESPDHGLPSKTDYGLSTETGYSLPRKADDGIGANRIADWQTDQRRMRHQAEEQRKVRNQVEEQLSRWGEAWRSALNGHDYSNVSKAASFSDAAGQRPKAHSEGCTHLRKHDVTFSHFPVTRQLALSQSECKLEKMVEHALSEALPLCKSVLRSPRDKPSNLSTLMDTPFKNCGANEVKPRSSVWQTSVAPTAYAW